MNTQEELYQFVACNYFATGEGVTVALLITRAYPREEDYATKSYFDEDGFHLGDLKEDATPANRAVREFTKEFGDYLAIGAEVITQEDFLEKYGKHVPDTVKRMLNGEVATPGNFHWHSEFHVNYG